MKDCIWKSRCALITLTNACKVLHIRESDSEYIYKEIWFNERVKSANRFSKRVYWISNKMKGGAKIWIHFQFITPSETISVSSGVQSQVFGNWAPWTCQFCFTYELFLWHLPYIHQLPLKKTGFFSPDCHRVILQRTCCLYLTSSIIICFLPAPERQNFSCGQLPYLIADFQKFPPKLDVTLSCILSWASVTL